MDSELPGSTRETAVVVTSAREEDDWLHEHYPGFTVILQQTVNEDTSSFDVVTLRSDDGVEFEVYFDITSMRARNRMLDYVDEDELEDEDEKKKR
jgi:hypothetical protein